ncbi:unnamed protein product [Fusarium fujikuroi]|nr:unnamed protein product [Fusarium fujikuroi]VZH95351.1 unnamed protein product [Fusarium fujikuroi]
MYSPKVGDSLGSLDTPSMIVDLDVMEANIKKLMDRLLPTGRKIRPHLKTSKSAIVAKKLVAAGAKGGCVAKLSEAEAIAAAGFTDLLITCEIVGPAKVKRLVELFRKHREIRIVVDDQRAATTINDALEKSGIEDPISVLIDLDVGLHRTGTQPEGALPLAKHISSLKHMRLVGVQGYEGHLQHLPDFEDRKKQCLESMKILTETAQALKNEGFNIEVVTTGGTGTADFCATVPGVTELQPGSFIFMDTDYRNAIGTYYSHSLSFLATVVSKQGERQVTIDTGLKSLTTDSGLAECKDQRYSYFQLGDEHGALTWEDGTPALDVGDRVEMIPTMTTQAPALTTAFTPAKSCFQYYKYRYTGTELTCLEGGTGAPSACTYMQLGPSGSDANCFPSSMELGSTFYYSPGICPSGFEVACSSTVGGETRATCCPSSFSCQTETGWPWYSTDLCTISIPRTVEVIVSESVVGGDWKRTTVSGAAANAIGIPIRWHSSDFASTTTGARTSATGSVTETSSSSTGTSSSDSSSDNGGLSTGAKAGIGAGVGVAVLAGLAALGWFVLRARRAKQANMVAAAGGEEAKEPTMQQQQHPWELDSHEAMIPAELPSDSVNHIRYK